MTQEAQRFSPDYKEARRRFISSSQKRGASLRSLVLPGIRGIDGETLTIDAARHGPDNAEVLIVTVSGTHGGEGYAGSAMQLHSCETGLLDELPAGVACLQIHAANPFGMSWGVRSTEHGIDLNRNWISFQDVPPGNPLFPEVWSSLSCVDGFEASHIADWLERYRALVDRFGQWAVEDALSRGQFVDDRGPSYGGVAASPSRKAVESLLTQERNHVRHVVYLDWHTLLRRGNGKLIFLCFNQSDDTLFQRATSWWGEEALARETVKAQWADGTAFASGRASRSGLMMWGLQALFAPSADLAGAVIEFCTAPHQDMTAEEIWAKELLCEKFLRCTTNPRSQPAQLARATLLELTTPQCAEFREGAIAAGERAMRQAIAGAGQWAAENVEASPGRLQMHGYFD